MAENIVTLNDGTFNDAISGENTDPRRLLGPTARSLPG